MLSIHNTQVFGLERAIIASGFSFKKGKEVTSVRDITEKDWARGQKLGQSPEGSGHSGYLKGIIVQADVTYPNYWTPEAQRYHFFEIVMSSSKMHTLCKNATLPDEEFISQFNKYVDRDIIARVQEYAIKYNNAETPEEKYQWFMKMQSNCPLGFELTMMVTTNYEQLKIMFNQRKNHRLKEDWGAFCDWCLTLPHFTELTGCSYEEV